MTADANRAQFDLYSTVISSTLDGDAEEVKSNLHQIEALAQHAQATPLPHLSIDMCMMELICASFGKDQASGSGGRGSLSSDEGESGEDEDEDEDDDLWSKVDDCCPTLHVACTCGYPKVTETLLEYGASTSKRCLVDNVNQTALHYACKGSSYALCVRLLELGASVDAKDANGNTPLHLAFGYADQAIAELFIKEGADVNMINRDGMSPLFIALSVGGLRAKLSSALIRAGADVNFRNDTHAIPTYPPQITAKKKAKRKDPLFYETGDWFDFEETLREEGFNDSIRDHMSHPTAHSSVDEGSGNTCMHLAAALIMSSFRRGNGPSQYFSSSEEERLAATATAVDQMTDEDQTFFQLVRAGASLIAINPLTGKTPIHVALETTIQLQADGSRQSNVPANRILGYLAHKEGHSQLGYNVFSRACQIYGDLPPPPSPLQWAAVSDRKGVTPYTLLPLISDAYALNVATWISTLALEQH